MINCRSHKYTSDEDRSHRYTLDGERTERGLYDELAASRMSNCRSHMYMMDGKDLVKIYDIVLFIIDRIFVIDV